MRVARVAHNTRYDLTVKQAYDKYINEQIQIGLYRPQDIVSIDETNFDFDQASGETLANRGDKTIGYAVTGSANRCTVLLACTMSVEKLPTYIIFKGKDKRGSRVCKDFSTEPKRAEHGHGWTRNVSWIGTQGFGLPLPRGHQPQGLAPT
jgi:hypothetical protein